MSSFKTPLGTELPLLNLKGKLYLQVAHRLVWFREEQPDWSILTSIVHHDEKRSVVRAQILDQEGRVLSEGTKSETAQGFPDHLEKSETGAIGRALALLGYGTQFAPEFDEGERLADSPIPPKSQKTTALSDPAGFVMPFGKYKGKRLDECGPNDLDNYAKWVRNEAKEKNKPIQGQTQEALSAIDAFLKGREVAPS